MTVEFGVLGALEVKSGGVPLDIGHARQRSVLAVLLAEANRPVSLDQLAYRVWGERPPYRAAGTLRSYLSRLRTTLPETPSFAIERGPGTYLLRVDPEGVDLLRFRRCVAAARAERDNVAAAALFAEGLGLWRGDAFSGLDSPWLAAIREVAESERHAARLDSNDIELRLGRHAELLSVLSPIAEENSFDERLAAQLILALYRSGRQADALEHYEKTRRGLAESLGTDPGPRLRRLYQLILNSDPELDLPSERESRSERDTVTELESVRAAAVLLIVVAEGGFAEAANRLLGKTELIVDEVDRLEDRIGGVLLDRDAFVLTALGESLREGVRGGIGGIGAAIAECRAAARRSGGRLRIGYVASIGGDFVAKLASEFERRNPGCRVTLTATRLATGPGSHELLAEDDLDLVLHWSPGGDGHALELPGLSVGPVIREVPRAVVVPVGHPLAGRESIVVEDLADVEVIDPGKALNPLARDLWTPPVTPSGRRIRLTSDDLTDLVGRRSIGAEDVLPLVARGYGAHITVTSVLDRYPFPGLTLVPVTDLPPMVVVPVWRTAEETHLIRAFVGSLGPEPRN